MKSLLLGMLWLYQKLLSPWIGNQCRFYPTCSEYARQAVEVHGSLRGSALRVGSSPRLARHVHDVELMGLTATVGDTNEAEVDEALGEQAETRQHLPDEQDVAPGGGT